MKVLCKHRGFNLLELVIVIVILGILASVAGPMMYQVSEAMIAGTELQSISAKSRLSFERMERELRMIKSNSAADLSIASNSITFKDINDDTITFSLSGANLMRNTKVLIPGVSSLAFTYYTAAGATTSVGTSVRYIKMDLTITQGNSSTSMEATVFPRNLS